MSERTTAKEARKGVVEIYGENVFNLKTMRNYLSESAYKSLAATINTGSSLDPPRLSLITIGRLGLAFLSEVT